MRTFVFIVTAVLAALVVAVAQAKSPAKTVGVVSSTDYRAIVVVHRTSGGSAPTAAVDVTTYVRKGSGWRRAATTRLRETFFWNAVSSPHAVCNLQLATAGHAHVVVQLLVTPSIGCGRAWSVRLP